MKSAKREESSREEQHEDLVPVKAEAEPEEAFKAGVGEDGLSIQIKEEPHPQEIGEEQDGEASDCKSGPSEPDFHQPGEYVKEEDDSIQVKEEEELWMKEERNSEEEADEREEESTGRQCYNHPRFASFFLNF